MLQLLLNASLCSASFVLPQTQDEQAELEATTRTIQAEIETLRGAKFARPVAVSVADRAKFLEYVKKRMEKETSAEEIASDEMVAQLAGVFPADRSYLETTMRLLESQVGGFYDPDSESFCLMEGFGGDIARIILAHELTHALDDQLHDIDGSLEKLDGNSDAVLAYHAVVEGSGTAVMNTWTMRHMNELDLAAVMEMGSMGMEELKDAPPFLWKPLVFSYLRGAAFLNRTDSLMKGQSKLPELADFARAFKSPPVSTEQVLHPEKYWDPAHVDVPVDVTLATANLPSGWKVLREDTQGELGMAIWTLPLDKRKGISGQLGILSETFTTPAAEGWGGDRFALLGKGEARLLVSVSAWDTPEDLAEFQAALRTLEPHLLEAAAAVATANGLVGSGVRTTASPTRVVLASWVGIERDVAEALVSTFGADR